jgi:hypothetical protein
VNSFIGTSAYKNNEYTTHPQTSNYSGSAIDIQNIGQGVFNMDPQEQENEQSSQSPLAQALSDSSEAPSMTQTVANPAGDSSNSVTRNAHLSPVATFTPQNDYPGPAEPTRTELGEDLEREAGRNLWGDLRRELANIKANEDTRDLRENIKRVIKCCGTPVEDFRCSVVCWNWYSALQATSSIYW